MKAPTLEQRNAVWRRIRADPQAKKALMKLKKDGLAIAHLMPHDPPYVCWADYFALIPFLPNRPSRRQLHRGKDWRKYLPLVKALRQFAAKTDDPFCEMRVVRGNTTLQGQGREFGAEFTMAADLIEKLISSSWSIRNRNPRNSIIAYLRGSIRHKTGTSHDSELATLIEAAFSAADQESIFLDSRTLERIEKLEMEGRVKAACRLNYISGKSPTPVPGISLSTRSPRNRKKHV